MCLLTRNIIKYIWHAFETLQDNGRVHKSKLKVLTANIGSLLDVYGVEKGLDHFKSEVELTFTDFMRYLESEVFSSLSSSTVTLPTLKEYETKISEVCWLICRRILLERDSSVFTDASVFKLFRIFCVLSELVQDEDGVYEVNLDPSEAGPVAEHLVQNLGLQWDENLWEHLSTGLGRLKWNNFLTIMETKYCGDRCTDPDAIVEAVDEVHDIFIKDIIKKGYLMKKGYLLPTMREYWFVLQPCELNYYKSSSEKDQCGRIELNKYCSVELSNHDNGKIMKFHLITPERNFEFATSDHKTRLQWISALQRALEGGGGGMWIKRGTRCPGDRLRREVRARRAAEAHAQELAIMAEADNKKLEEMRSAQVELERLLLEETQAKQDEEIVRALQARVLAEEWEKREELERLQEEQKKLLEEERLKRLQFERMQTEMEIQYKEAEKRLAQLELEKQRLDDELKKAQTKIKEAEQSAQNLELRFQVQSAPLRKGDRLRKTVSLIPTTKSSSDTIINLRATDYINNSTTNER